MQEVMPEWIATKPSKGDVLQGKQLRLALDSLCRSEEAVGAELRKPIEQVAGLLRYPAATDPGIVYALHIVSLVASAPADPSLALEAIKGVLYQAYLNRHRGLTYGGPMLPTLATDERDKMDLDMAAGAPAALTAFADATWGAPVDRIAIAVTYNGAAIYAETKRVVGQHSCSMITERLASLRASDIVLYAREILISIGEYGKEPTPVYNRLLKEPVSIACDNSANVSISNGTGSPSRIKHDLRRWQMLRQRVRQGDIRLAFVADPQNPSDFLSKWKPGAKFEASVKFLTGSARG